jgi:hypothetical protein
MLANGMNGVGKTIGIARLSMSNSCFPHQSNELSLI